MISYLTIQGLKTDFFSELHRKLEFIMQQRRHTKNVYLFNLKDFIIYISISVNV